MKNTSHKNLITIVGAGPAGIGLAVLLKKMGIKNVEILERDSIGASFKKWPKEVKFISPSFTSNFFSLPDLNAVSPDTSPAFNLSTEHPTGEEYAKYLENCVKYFNLKVTIGVYIKSLEDISSKYIIWAAGEYMYPDRNSFQGIELGLNFADIKSYQDLENEEYIIIGGNEAGMDTAMHLLNKGKKVIVIDGNDTLGHISSDSSTSLSPYTRDKIQYFNQSKNKDNLIYIKNTRVESLDLNTNYKVTLENGKVLHSHSQPIVCTGFEGSGHVLLKDKFEWHGGRALLSDKDESTVTKNLFLAGSHIVHDKAIFCFIYKFRQRFAIVAEEIVKRENIQNEKQLRKFHQVLEDYKKNNFYLNDLSGCCEDCAC